MDEQGTSKGEGSRPSWMDEAEAAWERAGQSLLSAWEETRDARMSALEAAKEAADELAKALDRGVEAARARWEAAQDEEAAAGGAGEEDAADGAGDEE